MKTLTKEQYEIIEKEVDKYNKEKYWMQHIWTEDIIHTYFNPN